jgi:hypothetical protein
MQRPAGVAQAALALTVLQLGATAQTITIVIQVDMVAQAMAAKLVLLEAAATGMVTVGEVLAPAEYLVSGVAALAHDILVANKSDQVAQGQARARELQVTADQVKLHMAAWL